MRVPVSTGGRLHLQFAFMSRARGRAQSRTRKGSWSQGATRCLQLPLLLLGSCLGSLAVRCSTARSCRGPKSANLDVHFALGKVLGITSLRKSVIIHGTVLHRGFAVLFMAIYHSTNVAYAWAPPQRGGRFFGPPWKAGYRIDGKCV